MNKALNMIGLSKRAGKLLSGATLCEKEIKSKRARLLLIAGDCSENSMDKFVSMAKFYSVPYAVFSTRSELGKYSGGGEKSVLAVLDEGFADAIKKLL